MKKNILFLIFISIYLNYSFGQNMFKGINYQATARSLTGQLLPNETISIKFNLVSNHNQIRKEYYSESHTAHTNELGLVSLILGEGQVNSGNFDQIPWGTENIWMEVAIKDNTQSSFALISKSSLVAVPYAMHAFTTTSIYQPNLTDYPVEGKLSSLLPAPGVVSKIWSVLGNAQTNTSGNTYFLNSLGTTDLVDLFLITDNVERLRITKEGNLNLKLNMEIGKSVLFNSTSGSTVINGAFTVDKMSPVKLSGTTTIDKSFRIMDSLNVLNMKPAYLTGKLTVDKSTRLNDSLTIKNMKPTYFTGALSVDKKVSLNDSLLVSNMGNTYLSGSLTVDKEVSFKGRVSIGAALSLKDSFIVQGMAPAILTGKLLVDKTSTLNDSLTVKNMAPTYFSGALIVNKSTLVKDSLIVKNMKPALFSGPLVVDKTVYIKDSLKVIKGDTAFAAYFENTNPNQGDGIMIKLGKTHPAWNGSYLNTPNAFAEVLNPVTTQVKNWVIDHQSFNASQLLSITVPSQLTAGTACTLGNLLVNRLNSSVMPGLKVPSTPINTSLFPAFYSSSLTFDLNLFKVCIGVPGLDAEFHYKCYGYELTPPDIHVRFPNLPLLPSLPSLGISIPEIPLRGLLSPVTCGGLPTLSAPNIAFNDVSNSLSNDNQFIQFVDKENRQLGSIRAVSVNNWKSNFLDNVYLINVASGLVGLDKAGAIANSIASFTSISDDYNSIGVEYMSGHADYAEWIERSDIHEHINAGDVVGVKGGKISKDLNDAEQILVISSQPIFLGNAPSEEYEYKGNKVAFKGQVPVKVMGKVDVGDYIIANREIHGYGMAMHPDRITIEDLKYAVGRAWQSNTYEGPKMINTLIGVDKRSYFDLIKKSKDQLNELEVDLISLERQMDNMLSTMQSDQSKLASNIFDRINKKKENKNK